MGRRQAMRGRGHGSSAERSDRITIVLLVPVLLSLVASGITLAHVLEIDLGSDPALRDVLSAAASGDTILVAPGRHRGRFRINDGVVVIATAGPDSTFLDGEGSGPVVTFEGVGPTTLLEGFTVTGGLLSGDREDGAGILCVRHASPRLNRNRVIGNRALGSDSHGGGIACVDGSNPVIANSRIEGNEAAHGGGIHIGRGGGWDSVPIVKGNLILRNQARRRGGGIAVHHSEPDIAGNVVAWNVALEGGGGLAIERSGGPIIENLIWENADSSGTASGILLANYASPRLERNIIGRNVGGPGLNCESQFQEWLEFRCNDVWGHTSGDFATDCWVYPGNLSVDPLLCDPGGERFGLQADSPCRDAPGCGRLGPWGSGCVSGPGAIPGPAP